MKNKNKIASYIGTTSRIGLIIYAFFITIFSLLSGAEGGLSGLVANAPNTIPWLLVLIILIATWKFDLVAGIIFILMGIVSLTFFDVVDSPIALFIVSFPISFFGVLLFINHFLKTSEENK